MTARRRWSALRLTRFNRDSVQTQRGFSIIELVFVLVAVMVISAIALPSFLKSSRPIRLRNDATALANLITMARMRASTEFSHVQLYCTLLPASGPAGCKLQTTPFPNYLSWVDEPTAQQIFLSQGVSFGIPTTITTHVKNQSSTGAYQGNQVQNTPTATNNPVIVFNSRGLPVDALTGQTPGTADYALYIKDLTGNYYAVTVNQTGRPAVYQWNSATLAFVLLPEYGIGTSGS